IVDRFLNESKRVDVFQLRTSSEFHVPNFANGDVRVASKAALFHVAVVDFQILQNLLKPREIVMRFGRRANIGITNDLDERNTAPIEVEICVSTGIRKSFMKRLAGVFLHMDPLNADFLASPVYSDLYES